MGELITTVEHTNGTGDDYWDSTTSSRQIVVSGIYIAVFENLDTGEKKIQNLLSLDRRKQSFMKKNTKSFGNYNSDSNNNSVSE